MSGKQNFNEFVQFVLSNGDRQTYCTKYNNNPHYSFDNVEIYLDPVNQWTNMTKEKLSYAVSDYNEIVIDDGDERYIRIRSLGKVSIYERGQCIQTDASDRLAEEKLEKYLRRMKESHQNLARGGAFGNGMIAAKRGDHQEAIAHFTDAIKEAPDNAAAYYNRGIAHRHLAGNVYVNHEVAYRHFSDSNTIKAIENAFADFSQTLKLDPDNKEAFSYLQGVIWFVREACKLGVCEAQEFLQEKEKIEESTE
jgi:tetratricopeptide (TPR) repeat protein